MLDNKNCFQEGQRIPNFDGYHYKRGNELMKCLNHPMVDGTCWMDFPSKFGGDDCQRKHFEGLNYVFADYYDRVTKEQIRLKRN